MTSNETPENEAPETLSIFLTDGVSSTARATTRALVRAGHKVTAVVNTTDEANRVRADGGLPISVDLLRDTEVRGMLKMAKANIIVNLRALHANSLPFKQPAIPAETLEAETKALVDAAQATEVSLLIQPSFAYLYGNTNGETVDESTSLPNDKTPIMAAGRAAEAAVKQSGIPYTILRAGYVYGGASTAMQNLIATLRSGKIPPTGERDDNYANWLHSSDLASAIALTVEKQPQNEIINVAGVNPVTPGTFLADLSDEIGISLDQAFGFIARIFSLPTRPNPLLKLSTKVTSDKAKEMLGWEPRYPTHVEGIEAMLIDMRAEMPF